MILPAGPLRMPMPAAIALCVLSGVIASYSYPPHSYWGLIFAAYLLLFWCVRGQGLMRGFALGMVQGLALYSISLSWFVHFFSDRSLVAAGAWLAVAFFCGFGAALVGWVSRIRPDAIWLPFLAAATLTALVHFRSEIFFTSFPWITPGLALGPVSLTSYLGVYGCGFLVVLACSLVVLGRRILQVTGVILAIALTVAALLRPEPVKDTEGRVNVVAVQGGFNPISLPYPIKQSNPEPRNFWNYWKLTILSDFRDSIVVWPETSTTLLRESEFKVDAINHLTRSRDSVFVIGTTRKDGNSGWFNEAVIFDDGKEVGSYQKLCPVPFYESCTPGTRADPVMTRFGPVGTPICYDTQFEAPMRKMAEAGAEVLIVPSRDDLAWTEKQHWQHAEILRHRALENDRWIAVANMHGISQIVDPHGNRASFMKSGATGALEGSIYRRRTRTPYSAGLWIFPYVLTCACVISYASLLRGRIASAPTVVS